MTYFRFLWRFLSLLINAGRDHSKAYIPADSLFKVGDVLERDKVAHMKMTKFNEGLTPRVLDLVVKFHCCRLLVTYLLYFSLYYEHMFQTIQTCMKRYIEAFAHLIIYIIYLCSFPTGSNDSDTWLVWNIHKQSPCALPYDITCTAVPCSIS